MPAMNPEIQTLMISRQFGLLQKLADEFALIRNTRYAVACRRVNWLVWDWETKPWGVGVVLAEGHQPFPQQKQEFTLTTEIRFELMTSEIANRGALEDKHTIDIQLFRELVEDLGAVLESVGKATDDNGDPYFTNTEGEPRFMLEHNDALTIQGITATILFKL